MRDLSALTDDELIQAATPAGWVWFLRRAVQTVLGLLIVGACLATWWFGAAGLVVLVAASAVAAAVEWVLVFPAEREVVRRFRPSLEEALQAVRGGEALAEGQRTLVLSAQVRPHGGCRSARIDLWPGEDPRGLVAARGLAYQWKEDPRGGIWHGSLELGAEAAQALLDLIEGAGSGGELPSGVRDGVPLALAVLAPEEVCRVTGNLSGLRPDEASPAGDLARAAMELTARALGRTELSGACDAEGNISLGAN